MGSGQHFHDGKEGESRHFRTGNVLDIALCHFIHDVYSSFLAPLLPLIIKKLSLSLTQSGFLSTVMQIPALANPWIGAVADRFNMRLFIVAAPAITAVPMSLIGVAPNYAVLLMLLFVAGISVALFHVPAPVMVAHLSGSRKGRGMSFFMTGGELARTLGPLAAVGCVSAMGLEGFYPVMVVGIAASLWLHFRLRSIPLRRPSPKRVPVLHTWKRMRYLFVPIVGIIVCRGFMHASMTTFLPTFIEMNTKNLWLAGAGLTLFEAAGVLGVLSSGPLSDLFGRRRILMISLVTAPAAVFLFAGSKGWMQIVALVFAGLSLLSTTPVMLALVQEHAGENPSAANGIYMMVSFLARSGTVVLVGYLGDLMGLRSAYQVSACLGLVGIPFIIMLPRSR